jgi:hypothetical protein
VLLLLLLQQWQLADMLQLQLAQPLPSLGWPGTESLSSACALPAAPAPLTPTKAKASCLRQGRKPLLLLLPMR